MTAVPAFGVYQVDARADKPVTSSQFSVFDGITDSQCMVAAQAAELVTPTKQFSDGITDSQCMVAAQAAELYDEAATFNIAESLIPASLFDESQTMTMSQALGLTPLENDTYYTLPADMRSLDWLADPVCQPESTLQPTLFGRQEQTPKPDTFTTPDTTINLPAEAPGAPLRPSKCLLNKMYSIDMDDEETDKETDGLDGQEGDSVNNWSLEQLRGEYDVRFRPANQNYLLASKQELLAAIRGHEYESVGKTIDDVLAQFENGTSSSKCEHCGKTLGWYHYCKPNKAKKQKPKLPTWLQ